jgi:CheY-like chemotaxis protein
MATSVVICDDSAVARKHIARALPEDWDIDLSFATSAREAIDAVRAGRAEVLFLDLTMPDMDGYQTLKYLSSIAMAPEVIVVSGDVQETAQRRVLDLGARAFLRKPVDRSALRAVLQELGRLSAKSAAVSARRRAASPMSGIDIHDALQEVVNVAVGQASALLGRLFDVFVVMPVPRVIHLESGDLHMTLAGAAPSSTVSTLCQGFIGAGVAGEALIRFNDASFGDLARLMKVDSQVDQAVELELLMDLANVLVGACLKGIADQLDIRFSLSHPTIVGQRAAATSLFADRKFHWNTTLAVEIGYQIEDYQMSSEVLLVFTEDSMQPLQKRLEYVYA